MLHAPGVAPRAAFITGASAGLGAAIAGGLADAGTQVVLAARREPELQRVADGIAARGGTAHVCSLDVRDPARVTAAMQRWDDELGGIDLVVANAGVAKARWSGKLEWARHVEPVLAVNVIGATATLVALLPRMVERGHGHVVGMSSVSQYRGVSRLAAYSASKAYLSHFLESLRIDLVDTGVAVTDLRPGYVRTDMTDQGARKLPFLVELDDAAERIVSGILGREPVVEFPLPIVLGMRLAALAPRALYERYLRRVRG